jgi:phosphopantothenoylcysteine decarboxylase/phosphopantothenate--cysteine ligase
MPEPEAIFAHAGRALEKNKSLARLKVLVTAGPTREAIDPVRFISNHSSGKMGVALASAAWRRGAEVTLIAGPLAVAAPVGVQHVAVESTAEMQQATSSHIGVADLVVMSAAPADYRVAEVAPGKMKKTGKGRSLDLVETEDILGSTITSRKKGCVVVGFALETDDLVANAQRKLEAKSLDMIVLNAANEPGAGFGGDTNRVTLMTPGGAAPEELALMSKDDVADTILDRAVRILDGR